MPFAFSRSIKLAWIVLALAVLDALVLLYFFDPATYSFYPRCPLHAITGLDCPTCGMLRAIHLLLHGQIRAAFAVNPLLFMALPAGALLGIPPARRWLLWAVLAALAGWFIWRNWLAP